MRSPLYRALDWAGTHPLVWASLDTNEMATDSQIVSLSIGRGSNNPSSHAPSTLAMHTTRRVDFSSESVSIDLSDQAAEHIAALTFTTAADIQTRFFGRRGATTARDVGRRGWVTTELTAASWDSVLKQSPDLWAPRAGRNLGQAATSVLSPSWAPITTSVARPSGIDTFHETGDMMTAGDVLAKLEDRLYLFAPQRAGNLIIRTLAAWENAVPGAAANTWPLSRAHVAAPITWSQPADQRREYRLQLRTPTGTTEIITSPTGTPTGTVKLEDKDWTDMVDQSGHWQRIYGLRAMTHMNRWSTPQLRVPLHKLIASPRENDRRAAGMLLRAQVGGPIPMAGDWPWQLRGVAYLASLNEQITHQGWWLTLGLIPHRWLAGQDPPIPTPRTWDQTQQAWDTPTTQTWQEGPTT